MKIATATLVEVTVVDYTYTSLGQRWLLLLLVMRLFVVGGCRAFLVDGRR